MIHHKSIPTLIFTIILSWYCASPVSAQIVEKDTLIIMTYNLLGFNEDDSDRAPHFQKIINDINPDILITQEMMSKTGSDYFLINVMNSNEDKYSTATYIEQNQLFYRKSILKCIETERISTDLSDRDFSAFTLKIINHFFNFAFFF